MHVTFVVDQVGLGKVSLRVIQFPLYITFLCGSPLSYIIWGVNTGSARGRNWETYSHFINMNNNNKAISGCVCEMKQIKLKVLDGYRAFNFCESTVEVLRFR
jgi:hypothetical protein